MLKSDVFKRSVSKNHVSIPDDEKQNDQIPTKLDFLRLEKQKSITDEESMKERRKRRKSRSSVTNEERSDPEEDSPRDDYKIEVVRRLMKGFSLNETVAYYRNLNSAEYAINPNNFSLDRYVYISVGKICFHRLGSEYRVLIPCDSQSVIFPVLVMQNN